MYLSRFTSSSLPSHQNIPTFAATPAVHAATVAMSTLPPFLQRLPPDPTIQETCVNAAFPHPKLGTSAHALWWPANVEQPRVVLMMIPGILRNSAVQYDTMSFN